MHMYHRGSKKLAANFGRKLTKVFFIFYVLLFSSCAMTYTGGGMGSGPLLGVHDRVIREVSSSAKSNAWFGKGTNPDVLLRLAKSELYRQNKLGQNEYFTNWTFVHEQKSFLIYRKSKTVVMADVMRHQDTSPLALSMESSVAKKDAEALNVIVKVGQDTFLIGEKVFYSPKIKQKQSKIWVLEKAEAGRVFLREVNHPENELNVIISERQLFHLSGKLANYRIDDVVVTKPAASPEWVERAKVVGVNSKYLLLQDEKHFFVRSPGELPR